MRLETEAKHLGVRSGKKIKVETTDNQCSAGVRKQMQNTESSDEEKPRFEIDLRVEGVLEDVILKDEEQMKEVNEKLEKLKSGSFTKSFREDLKNEGGDMTFGEESRRVIFELGNVELFELGKFQQQFSVILA